MLRLLQLDMCAAVAAVAASVVLVVGAATADIERLGSD